jgi:hypothetical protein
MPTSCPLAIRRLRRPDTDGYSEKTDDWSNSLTALFSSEQFDLPFSLPLTGPILISHLTLTKQVWDLCDRIVSAVIPWKGFLKKFFVHNYSDIDEYFDVNRRPREALLEQKVMGKEYDSYTRGKVKEYCAYF